MLSFHIIHCTQFSCKNETTVILKQINKNKNVFIKIGKLKEVSTTTVSIKLSINALISIGFVSSQAFWTIDTTHRNISSLTEKWFNILHTASNVTFLTVHQIQKSHMVCCAALTTHCPTGLREPVQQSSLYPWNIKCTTLVSQIWTSQVNKLQEKYC